MIRRQLFLLITAAGSATMQSERCEITTLADGGLVFWNATTQRCEPDVCAGSAADVLDLFREPPSPRLPGENHGFKTIHWGEQYCDHLQLNSTYARWRPGAIPSAIACTHELFDTNAARKCLANRTIVILGDSTLTEVVYGLLLLVVGNGTQLQRRRLARGQTPHAPRPAPRRSAVPLNHNIILERFKRADSEAWARHKPGGPVHLSDFSVADTDGKHLSVTFDGPGPYAERLKRRCANWNHRRFSWVFDHAGTQVRLRHRWIARVDICSQQGGTGLATLTDARLQAADVYLDKPSSVDAVIIASGHHDLHLGAWDAAKRSKRLSKPPTSPGQYARLVNMTYERLSRWGVSASRIFWLSNNKLARCNDRGIFDAYDDTAAQEATRRGAKFIDVSTSLERHFPQPFFSDCCGDDMGMHHGALIHMANKEKMLVASAFEIQHILGSLCPRLGT